MTIRLLCDWKTPDGVRHAPGLVADHVERDLRDLFPDGYDRAGSEVWEELQGADYQRETGLLEKPPRLWCEWCGHSFTGNSSGHAQSAWKLHEENCTRNPKNLDNARHVIMSLDAQLAKEQRQASVLRHDLMFARARYMKAESELLQAKEKELKTVWAILRNMREQAQQSGEVAHGIDLLADLEAEIQDRIDSLSEK